MDVLLTIFWVAVLLLWFKFVFSVLGCLENWLDSRLDRWFARSETSGEADV